MQPPGPEGRGFCFEREDRLPLPAHVASLAPRDLADARRLSRWSRPGGRGHRVPARPRRRADPAGAAAGARSASCDRHLAYARRGGRAFPGAAGGISQARSRSVRGAARRWMSSTRAASSDAGELPDRRARRHLASLAVRRAVRPGWPSRGHAIDAARAPSKLVCGRRATCPRASPSRRSSEARGRLRRHLPDGPGEPARPRSSRRCPARRSCTGRWSLDRRGPDPSGGASRDLRVRPSAEDGGALRHRGRPSPRFALAASSTTRSSGRAAFRFSTSLCRSRTWSGRSPLRSGVRSGLPRVLGHAALEAPPPRRDVPGTEEVRATGAANTLVFGRGGWRADNTDVDGIFDPLADHDTGEGRTAVVLGTGGAARAAVVAARRLGYEVSVAAGATRRRTRWRRGSASTRSRWDDVAATRSGPLRQRDARGLAAGGPARDSHERPVETGRSSSTASTGGTAADGDDSRRPRGALPTIEGLADVRRAGRPPGPAVRGRRRVARGGRPASSRRRLERARSGAARFAARAGGARPRVADARRRRRDARGSLPAACARSGAGVLSAGERRGRRDRRPATRSWASRRPRGWRSPGESSSSSAAEARDCRRAAPRALERLAFGAKVRARSGTAAALRREPWGTSDTTRSGSSRRFRTATRARETCLTGSS